ncbi:hemerythrin HHE cation binding domain-containing protein [Daldinia sp. FL1419]|nr:hemerythrin HHE cation binding domain-containing protein [Daldinia sp. FL1419]
MLRQSIHLVRPASSHVRAYGLAPSCIFRRTLGENHFPGNKAESLEHSQVFKISQAIQQDHSELEDYYNRITSSKDPDEQRRFQNAFVWELARHSIAEELVVYPTLEKAIPDGVERADKDRGEHQKVKEQLYEFQNLKPGDEAFLPTLEALFKDLKHHIKEEEEQDLVKLEDALGLTQSKELCQKFEKTKWFTPTRSHPSAPDKPPFETVVGLMTAPIDKIRDLFTKFPDFKAIKEYGGKSP